MPAAPHAEPGAGGAGAPPGLRHRPTYPVLLIGLLCGAAALRLAWIAQVRPCPVSDFGGYDLLARNLASGLGYRLWGSQPSFFYAPGYPFTLSLVYRAFGPSWQAARGANVVFDLIAIALTYLLAAFLFGRPVGLLAALGVALWPSHWAYCGLLASEPEFTALLVLLVLLVSVAASRGLPGWRWTVLLGMLTGLASLVRGVAFLLPASFGLFWALRWPGQWRGAILRTGVLFACTLLVVMPWTIRNRVVAHSWTLICGDAALSLWLGANSDTTGTYYWPPPALDPFQGMSPAAQEREAVARAVSYIASHPLRYIASAWPKLQALVGDDHQGWFWSLRQLERPLAPGMQRLEDRGAILALFRGYYRVMLVLAGAGALLALWRGRSDRAPWLPLLVLAYWAGMHMLVIGADRFHFPVTPLLAVLAALAVAAPFRWGRHLLRRRPLGHGAPAEASRGG